MARTIAGAEDFPAYTHAEFAADRVVHLVGLPAAASGGVWLLQRLPADAVVIRVAVAVYVAGLLAMLGASAAYNMVPASPLKAVLRRVDRCAIFGMIAGTYTPFALGSLPRHLGLPLAAAIWFLAGLGVVMEVAAPRASRRVALPLYLVMGWLVLPLLPSLAAAIGQAPLLLLVGGGIVYSLGAVLHAHGRLLFHNAVWHAMVLVAAGLHFAAIALLLPPSG